MLIWFSLLIPLMTILVIYYICREQIVWWELTIFLATLILVLGLKCAADHIGTYDTEWLTDKAVSVEHHEKYVREWEEWVAETGYTDSDGNYHVTTPAHFETRTQYHPECWYKLTGSNHYSINQAEYQRILNIWGHEQYTDLSHSDQRHRFMCPGDQQCNCADGRGDMFSSNWNGLAGTIEPVTWLNVYENRIQASKSVFNYPDVDEETKKTLFNLPFPDANALTPAILGGNDKAADLALMRWNAICGPRPGADLKYKRSCRMWILVFKGRPLQDAIEQENYFEGGNKNELILCIGTDTNDNIKWSHVISWTKNERLKIDIKDFVQKQAETKLNLVPIVDFLGKSCYNSFERREFEEFSYLTVEPPWWAVLLVYIFVTIASVGIAVFVVTNDYTNESLPNGKMRSNYLNDTYDRCYQSRPRGRGPKP